MHLGLLQKIIMYHNSPPASHELCSFQQFDIEVFSFGGTTLALHLSFPPPVWKGPRVILKAEKGARWFPFFPPHHLWVQWTKEKPSARTSMASSSFCSFGGPSSPLDTSKSDLEVNGTSGSPRVSGLKFSLQSHQVTSYKTQAHQTLE